jgi:hypothetical protein
MFGKKIFFGSSGRRGRGSSGRRGRAVVTEVVVAVGAEVAGVVGAEDAAVVEKFRAPGKGILRSRKLWFAYVMLCIHFIRLMLTVQCETEWNKSYEANYRSIRNFFY